MPPTDVGTWRPSVSAACNRVVKFVGCGSAAGVAKLFVPVIDSSVVNEFALAVEYRRLRRNFDLAELDQTVLGIAQRFILVTVFVQVLFDSSGRF